MTDTARLAALLAASTNGGDWRVRKGYPADSFQPKGYRYVQFGPTEKKANGLGTDQLDPENAELIVAAVTFLRESLRATPAPLDVLVAAAGSRRPEGSRP
jgi:hypothetical protein